MPELNDLMQWMDPTNWGFGALDARTVVVAIGAALIVAGSRLYRLMILSPGMVGGVLLSHHYAPAGDDVTTGENQHAHAADFVEKLFDFDIDTTHDVIDDDGSDKGRDDGMVVENSIVENSTVENSKPHLAQNGVKNSNHNQFLGQSPCG